VRRLLRIGLPACQQNAALQHHLLLADILLQVRALTLEGENQILGYDITRGNIDGDVRKDGRYNVELLRIISTLGYR
jgi:hypothetical protein